ncbi:hypothetical protein [Vibrio barjaei]|uniref:hypothetical protein n=1 Tax=Vibrio barjaei TaxID=1676683 RepID=UPI0022851636|nr:hypothetical protein [Vibrio barjaei]MCY9874507.1 hypothetical protein [Vibrio barjaei]
MELGNIFSTFGAVLLFCGYINITVLHNERLSFALSALGSLFMCAAFAYFESYPFFIFNVIWFITSIQGLFQRQKRKAKPINIDYRVSLVVMTVLCALGILYLVIDDKEMSSWVSVSICLAGYALFATQNITRITYLYYSIIGSIVSLPYLWHLGNYPSATYTFVGILLAAFSIIRTNFGKRLSTDAHR